MSSGADAEFAGLAREYLDDLAERHPDIATGLGDHRFDARLPDPSAQALDEERRALGSWAGRLAALDRGALSAEHRVDAAMMADSVARRVFELDELREHTWNPLLANPGKAIYQLLARDFAPLPDRLASVAGRLAAVPAVLAEARRQLGQMPRVHLETAITQFDGTIAMVGAQVDAALEKAEIMRFIKENFDAYKRPRDVEIVHALPKNAMQKVLKRELLRKELEKRAKASAEAVVEKAHRALQ